MENKDPYEEYLDWKKKENSKLSKISRQIKPIWVLGFIFILILGNYLVASKQMSSGVFFIILISFGILLLFLIFKENAEPKLIPEHIIKQIVYEALIKKKNLGIEIPFDAQVKVTLLAGAGYETDFVSGTSGIVKREVGVEVIRKSYKKNYVVSVHPYNGTILDIIPKPLGINSKDALGKDKQIVPVQFVKE